MSVINSTTKKHIDSLPECYRDLGRNIAAQALEDLITAITLEGMAGNPKIEAIKARREESMRKAEEERSLADMYYSMADAAETALEELKDMGASDEKIELAERYLTRYRKNYNNALIYANKHDYGGKFADKMEANYGFSVEAIESYILSEDFQLHSGGVVSGQYAIKRCHEIADRLKLVEDVRQLESRIHKLAGGALE